MRVAYSRHTVYSQSFVNKCLLWAKLADLTIRGRFRGTPVGNKERIDGTFASSSTQRYIRRRGPGGRR
jgi:hypothetical protein